MRDLYEKVAAGERISEADALRLFESKDLNAMGAIADLVRQRKSRQSRQLHHQSLHQLFQLLHPELPVLLLRPKEARCGRLPTFRRRNCSESTRSAELGITELHIVGGLHPSLPFSYYTDMLKALRALDPRLQLKCFTAIEILHLAWLAKKSVPDTLTRIEGGGPGFPHRRRRGNFSQRSPLCHRQGQGIRRGISGCPPHLASNGRPQHLHDAVRPCRIARGPRGSFAAIARTLQDETHGFVGFVPLPYQPENNEIPGEDIRRRVSIRLRTIAISRIYLDNFDHITAYWVGMGMKLAQVALELRRG